VTYRHSGRGKVKIYVDGVYKKKISLSSTSTRAGYIAYVAAWSTPGTHKVKVVIAKGRVEVDAFVVLK
jgi:hypothetical protein